MVAGYLIGVYVSLGIIVVGLGLGILYVCCSKRYRLSWFQRLLLDEYGSSEREPFPITCAAVKSEKKTRKSSVTFARTNFVREIPQSVLPAIVTTRYEVVTGPTGVTAVPVSQAETPWTSNVTSMGSKPSTIESQSDDLTSSQMEPFWVPPQVVQKKRAQSLIPQLLGRADSEEGSPSKTPTSSTSLQEMSFNFTHSEKLAESSSVGHVPSTSQRQRRRASMQDALDHTKINTSLYSGVMKQESFGSIQEENLGTLNVSLNYDKEQSLLTVRLIQARDLVPREFSSTANPYCQLTLLPNRRIRLQSRVQQKTLHPEFEEEFVMDVTPGELPRLTLEILLFNHDRFSRDECLGHVTLPLDEIQAATKTEIWKGIGRVDEERSRLFDNGDLMVSLSYLSTAERLTVVVLKARNLRPVDDKGSSSPFVKVSVIYGEKRIKKKKTSTKRGTSSPIWNEALAFNLGKEFMKNIQLEFVVYNDSLLGNNEIIGKAVLGPQATGQGLSHWNDMLNSRTALAEWHPLLPAS